MPTVDSGSDGENGEKPVRERLKHTTIDKTSADTSQVDDNGGKNPTDKPSILVEGKAAGDEASSDSKGMDKDESARKDPASKRGNEGEAGDGSLRKRAKEGESDAAGTREENGTRTNARTASPTKGSVSPQRQGRSMQLDESLTSPRRKRSRESFGPDEDTREQKIPSTEETRARRSSSEERRTRAELQGNSRGTSADTKAACSSQPIFGAILQPKPIEKKEDKPQTSSAAFAASGFASLSGNASPFGSAGSAGSESKSPESQPAMSSFASAKPKTNTFGSSFASTPSNFASASKMSGFGSLGGSAFGGGTSAFGGGPKLSSFASGGASEAKTASKKEEKPFGAPAESDEESDGGSESSDEAKGEDPPKQPDSPNTKFHMQEVHTGEDNEASIFTNRAKLFQFHTDTSSWKERGVGPIKVNVERSATSQAGEDTASEASSAPPTTQGKSRLLMRNHATHKVILNTPIFKEMKIDEQTSKQLLFVCPNEAGKMTTYMIRMSKEDDIKQLRQTVKDLQDKM